MTTCFFSGRGDCSGSLIRAHVVPRQLLKREFPSGVLLEDGEWRRMGRCEDRYDLPHRTLRELCDDERSWVPCCGGTVGISGHHGAFDYARTLRIERHELPIKVTEFADELGLSWWLDREYGLTKQGEDVCQ